jgi:hypothetical protein
MGWPGTGPVVDWPDMGPYDGPWCPGGPEAAEFGIAHGWLAVG